MVPKEAVSAPRYDQATSAKELFDMIGETVQEKVRDAAKQYVSELKGDLSQATYPDDTFPEGSTSPDPCDLDHKYHTNVTKGHGKEYPCRGKDTVRFSDTKGAECDYRKIEGNKSKEGKSEGACAPYRRLHLCDRNLENINDYSKINNTHNLLLEVSLAAKHEGEMITGYYPQYQNKYRDSPSQICTMLARSFADIGDIIRGKDLYRGNNKRRQQLENNLKTIFGKIYDKLKDKEEANERYKDGDGNYFQLREDWWEENRETVWKAIACNAGGGKYFRNTCFSGQNRTQTRDNCRCIGATVPTYFDYVPQYLRWFEEWAEDFCRKRKKKLQDAKKFCRGEGGNDKYCDLNGYDCKNTAKGKNKYKHDQECIKCSSVCNPFGPWIDNQKQEFDKQKEKYQNEISGGNSRKKRSSTTNNYKGYDEEFYEKLKDTKYKDVDKFLDLLSNQTACQSQPYDDGRIIDINFKNNKRIDIFSHTEYCQACPWCGLKYKNDGTWERLDDMNECVKEKKKSYNKDNITKIPILTPDRTKSNILEKYKNFCKNTNAQIKNWQCYYDEYIENKENGEEKNNCIQGEWETFTEGKTFRSYYFFFWIWVTEMLIDSIDWRTQLSKCINNESKPCKKNNCNDKCKCYESWVEEKKKEWTQIKDHFGKQKDLVKEINGMDPGKFLENVLDIEDLFENIKYTYGYVKEIDLINKMLNEEETTAADGNDSQNKTTIDKLLQHEAQDANRCKKCQDTAPKKPAGAPGVGRSHSETGETTPSPRADPEDEDDEEEEEEVEEEGSSESEEVKEVKEEEKKDTPKKEGSEPPKEGSIPKVEGKAACEIVKTLFSNNNALNEACSTKYVNGREKFPNWKCIPSATTSGGSGESTKSGESATPSAKSGDTTGGSICVPPRRRKLYVGKLEQWAKNYNKVAEPQESGDKATQVSVSPGEATPATSQSPKGDLLTAFVESAAVETFFLWDRYKKEWEQRNKPQNGLPFSLPLANGAINGYVPSDDENNPQSKLQKSGTIPPDFLRQMFYTLGDYRDILVRGGSNTNGDTKDANNIILNASGNKEKMKEIQQKIDTILKQIGSKPASGTTPTPVTQNNDEQRKKWWEENGPHIWHSMICALTYTEKSVSGEKNTTITQDESLKGALLDKDGNKPKQNGTNGKDYTYGGVRLEDENSGTQALSPNAPASPTASGPSPQGQTVSTSGENTPLDSFIKRPTYFRWLEEWGENFCKERKKRLEKIKGDCKVDQDNAKNGQRCSGYGEDCETNLNKPYNILPDLECRTCGEECTKYKKWINTKKTEYEKQKNAYTGQKKKCVNGSNKGGGNGVCGTLEATYTEAKDFLQMLGPCKIENGVGKTDFDKETETFKHTNLCDPCSKFNVNCKENGNCTDVQGNTCTGTTVITAENINNSTDINMLVSDKVTKEFDSDLRDCQRAGIFEGIRKDVWLCGKVCGYNVCKPIKYEGEKNDKKIILITAFVKRWLEYFLEDYNKIKHRISHCTHNSEGNMCKNDCQNKCNCVKEWIEKKRGEWEKIRKRFLEQYKYERDEYYPVKTILETLIPQIPVVTDKGKQKSLENLKKSLKCNCPENSRKNDGNENDVINCMLTKLDTKIKTCLSQTSDVIQPSGESPPNCGEKSPNVEDDDEPLEETEENQVEAPKICPKQTVEEPKETEEGEEKCEPESTIPKETESTTSETTPSGDATPEQTAEDSEDSKTNQDTESETKNVPSKSPTPPSEQKDKAKQRHPMKPPTVLDHPAVIPALVTSTLAWSVGIGFATFTYFFLKVLYIYMYMCFFVCICICGVCLDIYLCICMCFIYIFYIYVFILIKKKMKKRKKKNLLK